MSESEGARAQKRFKFRKTLPLLASDEPENLRRALHSLLTEAKIGIGEDWDSYPYWIATLDGELVGCASLVYVGSVSIFHSLAVQKARRRQAIGTELMKRRIHDARANGAEIAVLMSMFWNVNFFRRFGFNTTSRKLLPGALKRHGLIFDVAFRKATPMVCML